MPAAPRRESIHDLPPLETGGVEARQGFGLQDHVAAGFCLEMIGVSRLVQVWCETQDDITLILDGEGGQEVEFVQVKGHDLDQLWSVAKLCERERKNKGSTASSRSILEKSTRQRPLRGAVLVQDRHLPPPCKQSCPSCPTRSAHRIARPKKRWRR